MSAPFLGIYKQDFPISFLLFDYSSHILTFGS
nr:MAG TPA: hypothetical protein [Bacteriophage sp.]